MHSAGKEDTLQQSFPDLRILPVAAIKTHEEHDDMAKLKAHFPDIIGIVCFPPYEPSETVVAARDNDLLPPGITRHIFMGRTRRLNYPVKFLKYDTLKLDKKNKRLLEWVQEAVATKHVRYYAEPTFLFDE